MKIVVDAGHGGADPGAVNEAMGVEEKALNLQIAIALQGWLMQAGHTVLMTRSSDIARSLADRVAICNLAHPDAFISIHCNAAENKAAHGMEVWTTPGETKADSLATAIGNALAANLPTVSFRRDESDGDLDKEGRLYVLVNTACPAVLVECGFVSNDQEAIRLKESATIQTIAHAIAIGVSAWTV